MYDLCFRALLPTLIHGLIGASVAPGRWLSVLAAALLTEPDQVLGNPQVPQIKFEKACSVCVC